MQLAARLPRRCGQHRGLRGVRTLERLKRQRGRCVGMGQWVDQFGGPVVGLALLGTPVLQQRGERSGLGVVGRRARPAATAFAQQVVNQHRAVARCEGQHFVHTVGVEGHKCNLRRIATAQVQPHFAAPMAHHDVAPGMQGGQADDQRAEHAGRFFGVSMWHEEAPFVVEQQLVQLGHHARSGAKPQDGALDDGLQRCLPA